MTHDQKYKLFKRYIKSNGFTHFTNLYGKGSLDFLEIAWMKGFEACEDIYNKKLQKYLDDKGI